MKRVWILALTLCVMATLCGCGSTAADDALLRENEALRQENAVLQQDNAALLQQLEAAQGSGAEEAPPADPEGDNPIDAFFDDGGYWNDGTTVVMNAVSGYYCAAWKEELHHMAAVICADLTYEEDKERVAEYVASAEEQAEQLQQLALFACADTEEPPETRLSTAGTIYPVLVNQGAARTYQTAFFQLMGVSRYSWEGGYEYAFDPEVMRAEMKDIPVS